MELSLKAKLQSRFLDGAIAQQLDPVQRRFLAWVGRDQQRAAKRQLRKPRQKRLSELTETERERFERDKRLFQLGLRSVKPRRPDAPASVGEPPRIRFKPNPLRDGATGILFALNDDGDGVVVGPSLFGDGAAEKIEKRHPFNSKAFETVRPTIPRTLQRAAK